MWPALARFFSTPGRQALAWSTLGIAGVLLAGTGFALLQSDDGPPPPLRADDDPRPSPTATPTPSTPPRRTPTPSGFRNDPRPGVSPSPTPTVTVVRDTVADATPAATATSTATATPTPVLQVALPYCPPADASSSPPNAIFGRLLIGGEPAPAGTSVQLTFDGVPGPAAETSEPGGYRVFWYVGDGSCANRAGAAIAVTVNGIMVPAGIVNDEVVRVVDISLE